jgi:hypothetical protein
MDVHVRRPVTIGLRLRQVDVVTAEEDNARRLPDPLLLDRATELGRVLFSQDDDLLKEAVKRQREGGHFAGLVYAHQLNITVRRSIDDLELLAKAYDPEDMADRIVYLPLR